MIRSLVVSLILLSGCVTVTDKVSEGPLPAGSGIAAFEGLPGTVMRVHYHRPDNYRPDAPILMVLHGVKRNADWYRDVWRDLSDRHGFLVLAPEFDRDRFPGGRSYNRGNMRAKGRAPVPQQEWSFNAVEALFNTARAWTGSTRQGYLMFGHSAGAQFVHCMITFMPELRLEGEVAANAGWYTMPDRQQAYPYGLDGVRITVAQLRVAFGRNLTVMLGDADTDSNHRHLHNTPAAKRQGPHRYARGLSYFDRAQAAAAVIGVPFAWRLEIIPDAGHSTKAIRADAAEILLHRP